MKKIIVLVSLLFVCLQINAQRRLFLRVYDFKGKKIYTGVLQAANDSILILKKNSADIAIPVNSIGTIRTKHSIGNNILFGMTAGIVAFGAVGIATADPTKWGGYNEVEGLGIGAVFGAPIGVLFGTASGIFKNAKTFEIDGDKEKWKAFILFLAKKNYLPDNLKDEKMTSEKLLPKNE